MPKKNDSLENLENGLGVLMWNGLFNYDKRETLKIAPIIYVTYCLSLNTAIARLTDI